MSTTKTVITRDACARLMLTQLRALQRQHRAGITPRRGQLEELFDTADLLERSLEEKGALAGASARCSTLNCVRAPMGGDHNYAGFCYSCAGKAIAAALQDGWQPPPLAMRP